MGVEGDAVGSEVGVVGTNTQIMEGLWRGSPFGTESPGDQESDGVSVDDRCARDREVDLLMA